MMLSTCHEFQPCGDQLNSYIRGIKALPGAFNDPGRTRTLKGFAHSKLGIGLKWESDFSSPIPQFQHSCWSEPKLSDFQSKEPISIPNCSSFFLFSKRSDAKYRPILSSGSTCGRNRTRTCDLFCVSEERMLSTVSTPSMQ